MSIWLFFILIIKNTREKLVEMVAHSIQDKGNYGAGITEVVQNEGVPIGSFYHHF